MGPARPRALDGRRRGAMVLRILALLLTVAALGARPAWAEPALWAVHGPKATVYLLGSVHALRPGTEWEGVAIRRAFDAAEECWFEIDIAENPGVAQAKMLERAMDREHPLSTLLTPDQQARLAALASPGERALLELMRPWFAALYVATKPLLAAGYDPALGVDSVLAARAKSAGKRVGGIETPEAQAELLAGLPQQRALELLAASLEHADGAPARMEQVVARWQAGDVQGTMDQAVAQMREEAPDLYRRLFTDRNEGFAKAIRTLAEGDKPVLVTIGTGHLVGPDNVRELLARQGVTFERVLD